MLACGFWLRKGILSVLMAAKPHREYDSCRASIVTAECCLSTAQKYHGLDQIPMAIIRYCGSEPKVNQCLNISFSRWIAKASFFPCSLSLVWFKSDHLKLALHYYFFIFSLFLSFFCSARRLAEYWFGAPCRVHHMKKAGQGLALRRQS